MSNIVNKSAKEINLNNDLQTFTEQLKLKVHQFGDFQFEDDIWYCKKKHKDSTEKAAYTINFISIPEEFKTHLKYFALMLNNKVPIIKEKVRRVHYFLEFFRAEFPNHNLSKVNRNIIDYYEQYLSSNTNLSENTKSRRYGVLKDFFSKMSAFPEFPSNLSLKSKNPFKVQSTVNPDKYIPTEVIKQFDLIMKDEMHNIPNSLRLAYWLQRSFPNRITEVTSIPYDCLKSLYSMYSIQIPTYKQNGGFIKEEIKTIPILNSGHGKYIVDLIKKVQFETKELLQKYKVEDKNTNYLLLSLRYKLYMKNGKLDAYIPGEIYNRLMQIKENNPNYTEKELFEISQQEQLEIKYYTLKRRIKFGIEESYLRLESFNASRFNNTLNRIAELFKIKDADGQLYKISSHQFRHNASTDRLYIGGYTVDQLMAIRNDKGVTMPMQYIHQHKEMHKQMWLDATGLKSPAEAPVEFKGRIFNLEDSKTLGRLSKDPKMYLTWEANSKKGVGLCSMISNCKPDGTSVHFECYECNWFVPKAQYYEDYKAELSYWGNIANESNKNPNRAATYENAIRNINCLERIIKICENGIEKYKQDIQQRIISEGME